MSEWTDDDREIRSVKLTGVREYDGLVGDRFERFERPGEYCFLPWVRIVTYRPGHQTIIEAPLNHVEFIELAPASVDRSPQGEDPEAVSCD